MKDYIEINKKLWNARTEVHVDSEFYDNDSFIEGRNSLNSIELDLLGDVKGKSILHLQCHFGQDSISLSRMGADVTGVDLSNKAIEKAKELSKTVNTESRFICSDIYDLPNHLNEKFDVVFTSYGTIGWLPNLDKWANIVQHFLKEGGQFVMADFHPVVWMFDGAFSKVEYRYLNSDPIEEIEEGTYTDSEAKIALESVSWNHGLSEILQALINKNLQIKTIQEIDYSPYNCFDHTEEFEPGKFRIKHLGDKIPMVYAIVAMKE